MSTCETRSPGRGSYEILVDMPEMSEDTDINPLESVTRYAKQNVEVMIIEYPNHDTPLHRGRLIEGQASARRE